MVDKRGTHTDTDVGPTGRTTGSPGLPPRQPAPPNLDRQSPTGQRRQGGRDQDRDGIVGSENDRRD